MLKIGLTGGIASGKSAAARIFQSLGVPIIDADDIARELLRPGTDATATVTRLFGSGILDHQENIDRSALRRHVFSNPNARRDLEAALHPLILSRIRRKLDTLGDIPYAIVMAPLLIKSGLVHDMDRVLVIDCPTKLQLERLRSRDGESAPQALRIIAAQVSRKDRLAVADDIIVNNGGHAALATAVRKLHRRYLKDSVIRD